MPCLVNTQKLGSESMQRRIPPDEWFYEGLPWGRVARLESFDFDTIVQHIVAGAKVAKQPETLPFNDGRTSAARKARQTVFRIRLTPRHLCDTLYSGRDGLRARYWLSPEQGDAATGQLITALLPMLLEAGRQAAALYGAVPMAAEDLGEALVMKSAKVWPIEVDWTDEGLKVRRWMTSPHPKWGTRWRFMPEHCDIEVKSALIDLQRGEHIPGTKVDRAEQIYRHGFT